MSLICGISSGWPSPVLVKLTDENYLDENPFGELISSDAESWIGSLLSLGAVLGPIPFGLLSDKIGRKYTLLLLSIPMLICYIILAFSKVIVLYYIARFILGTATGGAFTVLPMYVAEISEVSNRGILTSLFNGMVTFGILFSYVVGSYVHLTVFNLICGSISVAFILLFLVFCPESPTYLVALNKTELAKAALQKIRLKGNLKEIEEELQEIEHESQNHAQQSFKDFFQNRGLMRTLLMSMTLIVFQPFSGCDCVLFYSQSIFEKANTGIPSHIASIIVGSVQFLSGQIALLFVDRSGRKPLLMLSSLFMVLSEVPLGVYFFLNAKTDVDVSSISWLPIVCLLVYSTAFSFGFGPVAWTVTSEVFPSHVRTLGCGITTTIVWTVSFATTSTFLRISEAISTGGTFWIFSGFAFLGGLFVYFVVPETKGKTFTEIQKELGM